MFGKVFLLLSPIVALVAGRTLASFRHTVPEGYVAVKRRMGKIVHRRGQPVIYKGGYVFCLPGVHKPEMYHESNNPLEFRSQVVQLREGVYVAAATVLFGITDMRAVALADTEHVKRVLQECAESVLIKRLQGKKLRHIDRLEQQLKADLEALTSCYGVTITRFIPRAVPTELTQTALVLTTRAVKLKAALGIMGLKADKVDPSILVAAVGGQGITQAVQLAVQEGAETPAASADGLGQVFTLPHQASGH